MNIFITEGKDRKFHREIRQQFVTEGMSHSDCQELGSHPEPVGGLDPHVPNRGCEHGDRTYPFRLPFCTSLWVEFEVTPLPPLPERPIEGME